jgi:hypothetical protein
MRASCQLPDAAVNVATAPPRVTASGSRMWLAGTHTHESCHHHLHTCTLQPLFCNFLQLRHAPPATPPKPHQPPSPRRHSLSRHSLSRHSYYH